MGLNIFYGVTFFLIPLFIAIGTVWGVFQDRMRKSLRQSLCIFGLSVLFILLVSVLFSLHWKVWNGFLTAMLVALIVIVCCCLVFRCHFPEALFVFFIVKCYMDAAFSISKLFQYYLIPNHWGNGICFRFGLAYVGALILTAYPFWLFVRKLLRPLINKTEQMKFWYLVWMVPLLYYLIYRFGISPNYESPELLMVDSDSFLPILWVLLVFISLGVMVKMMLEATRGVEEAEKRKAFERQLLIQQEQYKKIQAGVEYARKLNHDERHHFLAINGYVEKRDIEGLKEYLQNYKDTLLPKEPLMICDNYAINAVAQHFFDRAVRGNVKIEIGLDIPKDCGVVQSDLVVLIGNLMENAAEACMRQKTGQKHITIQGKWVSSKILTLIIENSFDGEIVEKNGVFQSSKRKGEGIGISSVREIVSKYNGVAKFEYSNAEKVFKASMLLNL